MKKKNKILLILTLLAISSLVFLFFKATAPKKTKPSEVHLFETEKFGVKVSAGYIDGPLMILRSSYFDVECKTKKENTWNLVFSVVMDDPMEIPKEQIVKINEDAVYTYICWIYSVTVDGGETWYTFDFNRKYSLGFIEKVEMELDGRGKIYLYDRTGSTRQFNTSDFGRTWNRTE